MRIPIKISPSFFCAPALIGWVSSRGSSSPFFFTLIWIGVIFISVLFHEYGHALTSYYFGQNPSIRLAIFGGVTQPKGLSLRGWREFLVILNGPLFGFFLFLLSLFLLSHSFFENVYLLYTLKIFAQVNLFWTAANLLPIIPLDGGHLFRVVLESIFGIKGLRSTFFIGIIFAFALSFLSFYKGYFILGSLLFFFAFENIQGWRKSKILTKTDQNEQVVFKFKEAEELLRFSKKEEAESKLEAIRAEAKEGMVFHFATEYLAAIKGEKKEYRAVYDLLLAIKKDLSPESKLELHRAAYEIQDYPLVVELSGPCFQLYPDPEIALRNAEACAALAQVRPTVGWIQAGQKVGLAHLEEIVSQKIFDQVRETDQFKTFLNGALKSSS